MSATDEIERLEEQVEQLEMLLGDAESYLQHKATCARLLTKRECDCGLVELMTRVHDELENGEEEEEGEEDEE